MSRRTERRSFLAVPVRVSGIDAHGKSFRHVVCTLDLSARGARITSLQTLAMKIGQELVLEHQRDRVRFEVVWIGEPGTSRQGQIGLRTLEPGKKFAAVEDQIDNGAYVDTWQPNLQEDKDDRRWLRASTATAVCSTGPTRALLPLMEDSTTSAWAAVTWLLSFLFR